MYEIILETVLVGCIVLIICYYILYRYLKNIIRRINQIQTGEVDKGFKLRSIRQFSNSIDDVLEKIKVLHGEIAESKDILRSITDGIPEEVMLIDKDFKVKWINKKVLDVTGLSEKEIIGQPCHKITHGLDEVCSPPYGICPIGEVSKTGSSARVLHALPAKKGGFSYIEVVGYPVLDAKNEITQFICISMDVTERMKMIEDLRIANAEIERYSYELEKKVEDRTHNLRISMEQSEKRRLAILNILEDLKGAHKDLEKTHSDLRDAQSQIIQSEKMSAVGILASGIAHEVKNPLGTILLGTEYLVKSIKGDENISSVLRDIEISVRKADTIVRRLLDFSKTTDIEFVERNLNHTIETALGLLKYHLEKNHIKVSKKLKEDIPNLKIDKNSMEQVFINLFLNAIQVMPNGGELLVRTYVRNSETGDRLIVEIEDTGTGISEKALKHIFTPFFTTKRNEGGVGLGLSVTRDIVQMHKGEIALMNKKSGGVRVTLTFKV